MKPTSPMNPLDAELQKQDTLGLGVLKTYTLRDIKTFPTATG